jgi:hypothetical protein
MSHGLEIVLTMEKLTNKTQPSRSVSHLRFNEFILTEREVHNASRNLGGIVLGSIAVAVILAAIVAGIWYMFRGAKEKRTPETPQNNSQLRSAEPVYRILATKS